MGLERVKMTKQQLDIIKEYSFKNFSTEDEAEQFTLEYDEMAVSCPWMDLSGRFELTDEEAVKTYGLAFVQEFCEKLSETDEFKRFYSARARTNDLYEGAGMYIKDLETGKVRLYGSNQHDSLVISQDGTHLYYHNLHNGDSSKSGYRFVTDKDGHIPSEDDVLVRHAADAYFNIGGFEATKPEEI